MKIAPPAGSKSHVVFLQYGDYAEAWHRLTAGGAETFRDQKASVDLVADLRHKFRVTVLSVCERRACETLLPDLTVLSLDRATLRRPHKILALLAGLNPDLLILRTPHRAALLWARLRRIPTLPLLADTFPAATLRQRLLRRILAWSLSGPNVVAVANHSLNATTALETNLGLAASRLVPWDRPRLVPDPAPKAPTDPGAPCQAFYAGRLSEAKGVGDCLEAVALLTAQGFDITLDLAGGGDLEAWRQRAAAMGLQERVRFLGVVPNAEVRRRMRAATVVLVASRPGYPEGLPNTLCEALAARCPVLVSDHPVFAGRLRAGEDVLFFRGGDAADLAAKLRALHLSPALQSRLSQNAPAALAALHFGIGRGEVVQLYLDDPADKTGWVWRNSLQRLRQTPV